MSGIFGFEYHNSIKLLYAFKNQLMQRRKQYIPCKVQPKIVNLVDIVEHNISKKIVSWHCLFK